MPTNPEWLEHTENAAWDTVQTLRAEIQRERQRVERLTRLTPGWQKLLDSLQRLREEHAIAPEDPAEIVDALATKLRKGAEVHSPEPAPPARTPEPPPRKASAPIGWFSRLIESDTHEEPAPEGHAQVVRALERVIDDMAHAAPHEREKLAVEIGKLAFSIARASRRRSRP
jgi:hypothetical protein